MESGCGSRRYYIKHARLGKVSHCFSYYIYIFLWKSICIYLFSYPCFSACRHHDILTPPGHFPVVPPDAIPWLETLRHRMTGGLSSQYPQLRKYGLPDRAISASKRACGGPCSCPPLLPEAVRRVWPGKYGPRSEERLPPRFRLRGHRGS